MCYRRAGLLHGEAGPGSGGRRQVHTAQPQHCLWLWSDTPPPCHLLDESWVCRTCSSGRPWSSDEVVAVKAPDSCDTGSRAPPCPMWLLGSLLTSGQVAPQSRLDAMAPFPSHFASLSPPVAPSPASALDPLTSLFLPLKEFF